MSTFTLTDLEKQIGVTEEEVREVANKTSFIKKNLLAVPTGTPARDGAVARYVLGERAVLVRALPGGEHMIYST